MTESEQPLTNDANTPDEIPAPPTVADKAENKTGLIVAIVSVVLFVIAVIVGLVFLIKADSPQLVATVRDIFIILLALLMFVIGVALIILVVQLAQLTNLLSNEIKPILNSTNETVNTLKGTVVFLSDNLAEPVIKLNETLASAKKIGQIFNFFKK